MKKNLLIALFAILWVDARSQNDCKNIKKTTFELQGKITYTTPVNGDIGISFSKTITNDIKFISILASVDRGSAFYSITGIFIKLSNGIILKDEQALAPPHYLGDNKYRYYATLKLTEDQIDLLSNNKIVKYGIGDMELDVSEKSATKYKNWFNCLVASN